MRFGYQGLGAAIAMALAQMKAMTSLVKLPDHPAVFEKFTGNKHRSWRKGDKPMPWRGPHGWRNPSLQRAVNSMTNWQRNKWAGDGYPGLTQGDAKRAAPFAKLVRAKWL